MRTYNPILGRTDVSRRWFGSAPAAPELGRALVLVRPAAEPVVVWHGQPVPKGRLGEHRRYVVDVAGHGLSFTVTVASAEAVFPFRVTVDLACRILDPLTIVRDDIQDVTAALLPSLTREIRDTAARFDVLRPTEAARAIEARLGSAHPSPVVELGGYSVRVEPLNTQGVVEAQQELGVQELRRKGMEAVSHGTPEQRFAQLLATNNGDVREVLDYLHEERNFEAGVALKALQVATGGNLDDVDVADVTRNALGNLVGTGNRDGAKRETMRERVERRTKAALEKGQEKGQVVEDGTNPAPGGEQEGEQAAGEG
ncbi:hypothetical protein [Amycolatopsis sacchari]|uniref:hypothetical protein n=1 Tax=Amycolatopsis sacchari TaxID=115433 RepID=UPI003D763320